MIKSHILIGQYDSPFVRRVAVTLHHYGVAFERRVLSTFADFDTMLELGPPGKVPVFVDGTAGATDHLRACLAGSTAG
jgi:glutathione S-transferase